MVPALTQSPIQRSFTAIQVRREAQNNISLSVARNMAITAPLSLVGTSTAHTTTGFNTQLRNGLQRIHARIARAEVRYAGKLSAPNSAARSHAVSVAWDYEKLDVEMGGRGSANWNEAQRKEILETGRVKGAEGHHRKNVHDHPEYQADPNNIDMYKSKEAHRKQGHDGDFKNESNKDYAPDRKDKMVKRTNLKRVVKNELMGAGIAALVGFGSGFTISMIVSLAQNGISPENVRMAALEGLRSGGMGAVTGVLGYAAGRVSATYLTPIMANVLEQAGFIDFLQKLGITNAAENLPAALNTGVVGSIMIVIGLTVQFVRLKRAGLDTKAALLRLAKPAAMQIGFLALTIAITVIWGATPAGIVGLAIGAITICSQIYLTHKQQELEERLRLYTIDKWQPFFAAA